MNITAQECKDKKEHSIESSFSALTRTVFGHEGKSKSRKIQRSLPALNSHLLCVPVPRHEHEWYMHWASECVERGNCTPMEHYKHCSPAGPHKRCQRMTGLSSQKYKTSSINEEVCISDRGWRDTLDYTLVFVEPINASKRTQPCNVS